MPLGRLDWRLEHLGGEIDSDDESSEIGVPLSFSSCTDGQFTCNSGDCVDEIRYLLPLVALGFIEIIMLIIIMVADFLMFIF